LFRFLDFFSFSVFVLQKDLLVHLRCIEIMPMLSRLTCS
jgi:hypothetical protein